MNGQYQQCGPEVQRHVALSTSPCIYDELRLRISNHNIMSAKEQTGKEAVGRFAGGARPRRWRPLGYSLPTRARVHTMVERALCCANVPLNWAGLSGRELWATMYCRLCLFLEVPV